MAYFLELIPPVRDQLLSLFLDLLFLTEVLLCEAMGCGTLSIKSLEIECFTFLTELSGEVCFLGKSGFFTEWSWLEYPEFLFY